jgi:hypothetical protein
MNRRSTNPVQHQHSQQDELDRSLSRIFDGETAKDSLLPSSGFTARTMDSVLENVDAPLPLPFPWKRALPPFGCGLVILLYALLRFMSEPDRLPAPDQSATTLHLSFNIPSVLQHVTTALEVPLGWIALAMLVAFVSVRLCLRLAAPRV